MASRAPEDGGDIPEGSTLHNTAVKSSNPAYFSNSFLSYGIMAIILSVCHVIS
jgi:hypothetical protein